MPATALARSDYTTPGAGGGVAGSANAPTTADDGYALTELRRQYLEFGSSKSKELEEQREARHYYHGDQWSETEIAELKKRRQPVHTDNQVGPLIDGIVGLIERLRQDPKAFPRTPKEEPSSDLATEVLRYVMDAADWKALSPEAARTGAINGIGGVELVPVQGDHGDPDIDLDLIDAETFFYDPRSVRHDFSDARYMGVAKWVDLDVAKEMFPDREADLDGLIGSGGDWGSLGQRDREQRWLDTVAKRLFIVEHWYIKGSQWRFCFYTGATELKKGVSPFVDEKGKTFCRFLPWSAYVDHDGDRYGLFRNLKSDQDELNTTHSKARHTLNSRKVRLEDGAVDDVEKARREEAKPDGMIVVHPNFKYEPDDPSRLPNIQMQIALADRAKSNMENRAPNAALIGGDSAKNQSGRAIALLQQAGLAKLGPLLLAYKGWKLRVYRACWNFVQRNWTAERWVRVTDDEGAPQFIGINRVQMGPMGMPQMVNHLGSLDVDIILDEGPDSVTLMGDTLDTLERMAANGTPIPPQVVIELADIPGDTKRRIMALLEKAQTPDPQKQAIEQAGATAEVQKTQSETMKNRADAIAKVGKAVGDMMPPPDAMAPGIPPQPQAPQPGMMGS